MQPGDAGPVKELTLTRTDLVRYAGASHDLNPLHHDDTVAARAGMPSVFGHGMLSAGLLATAVEDLVGVGAVRRFAVRFVKPTWPGEVLRTSVVVTAVHHDDGGERTVDLECALADAEGETKVTGTATAVVAAG